MTEEQRKWLANNPYFQPIGPPRSVRFAEWGNLTADGNYERLDDKPGKPIRVGAGNIGVAREDTQ